MPNYLDSERFDHLEEITFSRFERLNTMLKRIYTILDVILSLIRDILKKVCS